MDGNTLVHHGDSGKIGSLYGQDMLTFIADFQSYAASAYDTARYLVTNGHRYPESQAVAALGSFDRAAFETLSKYRSLPVTAAPGEASLAMYVNSLGRLHIRRTEDERVRYDLQDQILEIGYVAAGQEILGEILEAHAQAMAVEERQFAKVKRALDKVHAAGSLRDVLELTMDHVQHVESVCFYVGDRFFAVIERFINLVESRKGSEAFLPRLRDLPYAEWSNDEILIVAALHALFLSGRSVRFEEFNGVSLTASALWDKLHDLLRAYRDAGCVCEAPEDVDLFDLARIVREQSGKSEGAGWLRYRWIYGLNFQKNERILSSTRSTEDPLSYLREFGGEYQELAGRVPPAGIEESEFFHDLAMASLNRDLLGVACGSGGEAVKGWVEHLIERIVASAVLATSSDYGMSSSLRDISKLVEPDDAKLMNVVHAFQPGDFFTCFVSKGMREGMERSTADTIAVSVQRRMMFNRWHFIPGNFERGNIVMTRHWYYPPMIPDIAIHSDVHRAAHARARVKYSVRAPGPDMSMRPLVIGDRPYRGFYDVRVVRMTGREFTTEDMLRTRRRTLWMSQLYAVLADHVAARVGNSLPITGFQPGKYCDIEAQPARGDEETRGIPRVLRVPRIPSISS
ncbi:MAG TPA: hypothetical protein VIX89_05860 [Bryobacteraceae bacterium]